MDVMFARLEHIGSDLWVREKQEVDRKYLFYVLIFATLIRIPLLIYPEVIYNDATE